MSEEKISYLDKPIEYERLLDIFMKKAEVAISIQTPFILFFPGLIIPLMAYILSWALPELFRSLGLVITNNINVITSVLTLISSSDAGDKIIGIVIFLLNSSLILFFGLIILLEILFFVLIKNRSEEKINQYLGFTDLEDSKSILNQLSLAKYEPEKWNLIIELDRDKKCINFSGIEASAKNKVKIMDGGGGSG